jgi:hypothetical protein
MVLLSKVKEEDISNNLKSRLEKDQIYVFLYLIIDLHWECFNILQSI